MSHAYRIWGSVCFTLWTAVVWFVFIVNSGLGLIVYVHEVVRLVFVQRFILRLAWICSKMEFLWLCNLLNWNLEF